MNFYSQKLFIPYRDIFFPSKTPDGKANCLFFYGENVNFIETYNFLQIKKQFVKHVFVPTIVRPRSYLSPDYYKVLKDHKLIPIKGNLGDYTKLYGFNFFFDATRYLNTVDLQYNVKRYESGIGAKFYNSFINSASGIDKNEFNTTILYAVNTDKPMSNKLIYKKAFVFYNMILLHSQGKLEKLPFERIILFSYNSKEASYVKLYDANDTNNNLVRFKNILTNLEQITDPNSEETNRNDHLSDLTANESKLVSKGNHGLIRSAIKSFMSSDSRIDRDDVIKSPDNLVTRSVVYNMVGDSDKAKLIAQKLERKSEEKQKEAIDKMASQILPREPAISTARNYILKSIDIPKMVDYQGPGHILTKRKVDFHQNLKKDIIDAFKTLEVKDIPLTFNKMEIKEIESGPSEIYKTIKDRYFIQLQDKDGSLHDVHIDIPHLTDNGSFIVNGQQKVLINQLVRFPIFFPSVNIGRFESSYSVMKLNSKELQNGAYIILFMGSYKIPLLMWLGYKYGLSQSLKDYGVTYSIK